MVMHRPNSKAKGTAESALVVFGLLALAVVITLLAGYVALVTMPCSWFGTSNEGACGYGALFFVLKAGVVLFVVLSAAFIGAYVWFQGRRPQGDATRLGKERESNR